ncbi:hypothetical protein FWK35_00012897, partial [Aphis craccivora]
MKAINAIAETVRHLIRLAKKKNIDLQILKTNLQLFAIGLQNIGIFLESLGQRWRAGKKICKIR